MNAKRWLTVLAGLATGGGLFGYLLVTSDLRRALAVASQARLMPCIGIAVLTVLFLQLKTWRWRLLLSHSGADLRHGLLRSVILGSAANFALPQLGEVVRAGLIQRQSGLPFATLLSSIVVERVLDMGVMAVLALTIGLAIIPQIDPGQLTSWTTIAVAVLMLIAVALWLARQRLQQLVQQVLEGFRALTELRTLLLALAASVLQWACMSACIALALFAVGELPTVHACMAVLVATTLALILPSAPGYAGTTQAAFLWALRPMGYDDVNSLAASIVFNATLVCAVTVAAAISARPRVGQSCAACASTRLP